MVVTNDTELPTFEELTVEEVPISTPGLRAAAHHFGNFFLLLSLRYITLICIYIIMFRKILPGCK